MLAVTAALAIIVGELPSEHLGQSLVFLRAPGTIESCQRLTKRRAEDERRYPYGVAARLAGRVSPTGGAAPPFEVRAFAGSRNADGGLVLGDVSQGDVKTDPNGGFSVVMPLFDSGKRAQQFMLVEIRAEGWSTASILVGDGASCIDVVLVPLKRIKK